MRKVKKNDDVIVSVRITGREKALMDILKEYDSDNRISSIIRRGLNMYFKQSKPLIKAAMLNMVEEMGWEQDEFLKNYDQDYTINMIKKYVYEKFQ
jgi:hypothetical protein